MSKKCNYSFFEKCWWCQKQWKLTLFFSKSLFRYKSFNFFVALKACFSLLSRLAHNFFKWVSSLLNLKIYDYWRFKRVILYTLSFKQNQKEHTILDYSIKEGIVNYNSLLYWIIAALVPRACKRAITLIKKVLFNDFH